MSKKVLEQFDKALQEMREKNARFEKNIHALASVPGALESFLAWHAPAERAIERIRELKHDFVVQDDTIVYRSEFSDGHWTFDPAKTPRGWRNSVDGSVGGRLK